MTILTSPDQVVSATPTKDLIETYNALSPKPVKKFAYRAEAERRVRELLSSGLVQAVAAEAATEDNSKPKEPEMASKPKVKQRAAHGSIKSAIAVATGSGNSKLQPNSERSKCLQVIARHVNGISVEKLSERLNRDARGFVQKLLETGHVKLKGEA